MNFQYVKLTRAPAGQISQWTGQDGTGQVHFFLLYQTCAELLEAWLALTSVKYHENLLILMLLNQWLAPTMLRTTWPWLFLDRHKPVFVYWLQIFFKSPLIYIVAAPVEI